MPRGIHLWLFLILFHIPCSSAGARHLFDAMPQKQAAVYRGRKDTPVTHGDDGIGALLDEVLQHVLSFLPLPEAVRTCVLARRWRHLWKSMPVLRVTGDGRTLNRRGVRKLNKFVNHLLLLRDRSAPLHVCEIELGTIRSQDDPQINLWIRHALLCQARTLGVHLVRDNGCFELDDLPLISLHLTRLELCSVVLKDDFLNFSCCPALEELWMSGCLIEADMISSQSLKLLTIIDSMFYPNVRTRISIPSLVTLELTECWGKTPLLESMPSLVAAFVKLTDCDDLCGKEEFGDSCVNNTGDSCGADGDGSGDCVLLKGLSEAKSLELIAEPRVFIFKRDLMWCPTFSKLKVLLLNDWCAAIDLHALVCFLQHTPVLEKLTLQLSEAPDNSMEMEGNYNLTEQPFASKQLKVIEVKCEKFDGRAHNILMILSTYGIYIEHINIQRSMRSFEEPRDIPQDSGSGASRARTQHISPSENAHMRSMIDHILAQQQQIFAKQEFLAQQQHISDQQQQILARQQRQRQRQILDQILAQLSEYNGPRPTAHEEYKLEGGHLRDLRKRPARRQHPQQQQQAQQGQQAEDPVMVAMQASFAQMNVRFDSIDQRLIAMQTTLTEILGEQVAMSNIVSRLETRLASIEESITYSRCRCSSSAPPF